MKIETKKIADLTFDPLNARTHDQKNLAAIAGSLELFGQRKPIVIDKNNVIVAGNGTVQAAKLLSWTTIDCVRVPEDWTDDQIMAFALADNRTAELAKWDEEQLAATLLTLDEADFPIAKFGFDKKEDGKTEDDYENFDLDEQYEVVIECDNEAQQQELLTKFMEQGLRVRAIVV